MRKKTNLGIVGLGMVGAPLMRWFIENGWQRGKNLFCYDADPKKSYFDDVSRAEVIFICVPTPPNPDGSCNTSILESVVSGLAAKDKILVIKSTVPPGTVDSLNKKYKSVFLFNPEFLTEAQAWTDFIRPDRQIVAYADEKARRFSSVILNLLPVGSLQCPGVQGTYKFHEVNSTEAELAKYGSNAFGALKVAFANVLADFCDVLGVDYENVRMLVGHDRRIGNAWLDINHGKYRGFGGYCFPKDLKALIRHGEKSLAKFGKSDKNRKEVFSKALVLLQSIWDYNEALLKSQGLSIEDVSVHDAEIKAGGKASGKR